MKKKLISLILCGIVAFSLVGCGDKEEKESNKESNSVVSTENNEENKSSSNEEGEEGESENTREYKTLTTDEAIEFNEKNILKVKGLLEEIGIKVTTMESDRDLVDGPVVVKYNGNGQYNEYNYIGYAAEIEERKVIVGYELSYYIDRDAIQAGTVEAPKARDLLIAEPYKIMTGDEISEELLDKIDEAIEYGCLNDNVDKVTLEENGPFKINVRVDGIDVTFQIISDGDGKGN